MQKALTTHHTHHTPTPTHPQFDLSAKALQAGEDFNGLLLLYSSTNDKAGLLELAALAESKGKHNVAFMARAGSAEREL